MKKRKIWTMGYFPFTMGGNVHKPMMTEIGFIEEKDMGKGVRAFSFKTPKGSIRIAEAETGAIVGDSFEQVKKDVASTSKKVLQDQIKDAKKILEERGIKHMKKEHFFKVYNY